MGEQIKVSCARPATELFVEEGDREKEEEKSRKGVGSMILIGKKAPDFTAPAYHNGNFINVKLSDYLGKWVVLCFYPGDFTFV